MLNCKYFLTILLDFMLFLYHSSLLLLFMMKKRMNEDVKNLTLTFYFVSCGTVMVQNGVL